MISSFQCFELYCIQFRNFDKWVLKALRGIPPNYQAFLPAAICIHSSFCWGSPEGNSISNILWPVTKPNSPLRYLNIWTPHSRPASRHLSKLLNDPSRAAEFLVSETHFTNLAIRCAKLAFGVTPPESCFWDDFESMLCLRLSLSHSSKSPELVQLLRNHAFQPSFPNDSDMLRKQRGETARMCLKYIKCCEASDLRKSHQGGDKRGTPKSKRTGIPLIDLLNLFVPRPLYSI